MLDYPKINCDGCSDSISIPSGQTVRKTVEQANWDFGYKSSPFDHYCKTCNEAGLNGINFDKSVEMKYRENEILNLPLESQNEYIRLE